MLYFLYAKRLSKNRILSRNVTDKIVTDKALFFNSAPAEKVAGHV